MNNKMSITKGFCMKNNFAVRLLFIISLQFTAFLAQADNIDELRNEASDTLESTKQKMVDIIEETAEIVGKAINEVSDQVEIKALEFLNEFDAEKKSTVDEVDDTLKEV